MTHEDSTKSTPSAFPLTLLSVGVAVALLIFVGTFYAYVDRSHRNLEGSYSPAVFGVGTFIALMAGLNYLVLAHNPTLLRLSKALGIALLEAVLFFFLLLFLIVNTLGS